jgi:hypothetical protein
MGRVCWEAKTPAAASMSQRVIPDETPPVSPNRGSVTARLPLLKAAPVKPQGWEDDDNEPKQPAQRSSVTGGKPAAQQRRIKPKQALFVLFGLIEVVSLGETHTICTC